ncbi:MAG TPA: 5-methyltetrahydropteroyltriglutamate--homocysteine S-methyltransferase, partial [Candidatus Sulfotelmatobacter sp.]|nr:5-methyltetrahydropteroyltriglutamate--homocysteine S-methyltransferase [Candidatus Sulfotelmatobacter sp.]
MSLSSVHGYPRIGRSRELKFATESYWAGRTSAEDLRSASAAIRRESWTALAQAGISDIPCNDFSLYDQVLDAIALVGAIPPRYGHRGGEVSLDTYF